MSRLNHIVMPVLMGMLIGAVLVIGFTDFTSCSYEEVC